MSGTSMDGLDIAHCNFKFDAGDWTFEIKETLTVEYPSSLFEKLSLSTQLSGLELSILDIDLGKWMGEQTSMFINEHNINIDFIASHGHTVFHQPKNGLTLQIGNGQEIISACNITVINDFRSRDVSLKGQGAPLVPIGDQLLFDEYEACLNLGGFANISYQQNNQRVAFDISPANIILNMLSKQLGRPYDDQGHLARQGCVDTDLLNKMNELEYYQNSHPKSLGYEWVENEILPIISNSKISIIDKVSTCTEHIANEISKCLPIGNTLLTGGGAYNKFLIERIRLQAPKDCTLNIPHHSIIDFKEALIFSFLGVLRIRNEVNSLSSVTGAEKDSCGGTIYIK
jgi:anhydro-N-acetylmuramic acid kinase